jgi:hypothetical protein
LQDILWAQTILFLCFGLVQLAQASIPYFRGRNRFIERTYIFLSFTAKFVLGVFLFANVLLPR